MEYYYFFGEDIPLEKHNLGRIHQPTLLELLDKGITISEFVYPFYLTELFSKEAREPIKNVLLILLQLDELNPKNKTTKKLRDALSLLYCTDNIDIKDKVGGIIIDEDIVIDENNFPTLSKVVLEMTMTEVKIEKKNKAQSAIIEEFEKRRKKYEAEHNIKSEMDYIDMFNLIVHMLPDISYDRIKTWTIYQVKNTYKILTERYNYETCVNAGAIGKDLKDWRSKLRIQNSKISD